MPIINQCLQYQERSRPSSEELCQGLAGLKESREYRESTHRIHNEIQSNSDQVLLLTQQLQEKDRQVLEKDMSLHQKENEIQERDRLLQQKERQLQEEVTSRERQFQQLNQQLEHQEQVTTEIQQTNHSLQRQVEQLQQQLSHQNLKLLQPPHRSQAHVRRIQLQERESRKQLPVQPSLQVDNKHTFRKMTLNWRDGGKAPFDISRGAAVVDGDMAYFMSWNGEAYSYNVSSKKWSKLPKCPYQFSSLAVINGHLTAIGGCTAYNNKDTYTNKLLSLPSYKEVFPTMPTKRQGTTAVTSKEHLIVAGGEIGQSNADKLNTVEMMDTKNLVWSTVASLPHPYSDAPMIICGYQLYMLGEWDDEGKTKSVLTCLLTELNYNHHHHHHHHHHHQYGTELLMPQLIGPPVQLSMESYWQLVDVMKMTTLHLPFTNTTQQLTPGISSAICQLLDII